MYLVLGKPYSTDTPVLELGDKASKLVVQHKSGKYSVLYLPPDGTNDDKNFPEPVYVSSEDTKSTRDWFEQEIS